MGLSWFGTLLALSSMACIIGGVSFLLISPEARTAAIFALPQRRNIERSRLVARSGVAQRLVNKIWHPERRVPHGNGQVDLASFDAALLSESQILSGRIRPRVSKRLMDIVLSVTLGLFTLPLLVLVAVLVRLDSPGPSFYRQRRVGRGGAIFHVVKFRTMRTDAELNGAQWAAEQDPRVTRLGRFLRKSRIDEIPQIWPIICGQMSFVGPRPERPEFTSELEAQIPHYDTRHGVRPGLTGWAQVNYPYGASVEDARNKLSYDLYYIKHQSHILDWFIVIKTLRVALFGVGSR